jgi:hypothetical protein
VLGEVADTRAITEAFFECGSLGRSALNFRKWPEHSIIPGSSQTAWFVSGQKFPSLIRRLTKTSELECGHEKSKAR